MSDLYNLVVIGAGAAGLTASAFGGELGAKVALIEKERLGGDCTWYGCVPSKALLKVARVAHMMRTADGYGIRSAEPQVDMKKVRERIQAVVQQVYAGETPEVFGQRGVEVIAGTAEFIDAHRVRVGERVLQSQNFVIASGARPLILPISGIDKVPYYTNETFFENDKLPQHLIVFGAGAIGMEMAQAYRRLGAQVTVVGIEVMPRDDDDAVRAVLDVMAREGVRVIKDEITEFDMDGETIFVKLKRGDELRGDMLLVAVGRAPTVDGLGLDNAGVRYSKQGIKVNKHLQTNIPHIYAAGDCVEGTPQLTHYAGFQGSIAGRNALIPLLNSSGHTESFPWVTFTEPEVAQVGLTERAAREKHGDEIKVFTLPMTEGDRAVAEHDLDGFIKIVYRGGGDLLGVTIVAARAGEMIQEFTAALSGGGLRSLISSIHAYPTYADIVKKASSKVLINELLQGTSGQLIETASKILWRR